MRARFLSVTLAALTVAAGCASNSYRISDTELMRLAQLPPQTRSQAVRVDQEISNADLPEQQRVDGSTEVIFVPNINVGGTIRYDHPTGGHGGGVGGGGGGGGGSSGSGGDGKAAAIAILVVAAVALFAVAAVEGARYDGIVNLHPMHPVHVFGKDGGYVAVPMAWVDPQLASWADHAIVKDTEGPWKEVARAPLWRQGPTYAMYGGQSSFASALGDRAFGPSFLIQAGYYVTDQIGLIGTVFFGWRDNQLAQTLYESRFLAELHYMPLKLGPFHAGVFGGGGLAHRFEDGVTDGNASSVALTGGARFELELHTRIALTARLGTTWAHGEQMADAMVGLAVY